jgi:hypothetical protein
MKINCIVLCLEIYEIVDDQREQLMCLDVIEDDGRMMVLMQKIQMFDEQYILVTEYISTEYQIEQHNFM